jgi:deltex-like protein
LNNKAREKRRQERTMSASKPKPRLQEVIDLASFDETDDEGKRPPLDFSPVYDATDVEHVVDDDMPQPRRQSVDRRGRRRRRTHDLEEEDEESYVEMVDRKRPRRETQSTVTPASCKTWTMPNVSTSTSKYAVAPASTRVPNCSESDAMLAARLQREEDQKYENNTLSDALLAAALQEQESADDDCDDVGDGDTRDEELAAKLPQKAGDCDEVDGGDDPDAVFAAKLQKHEDDEEQRAVNDFAYATQAEEQDASLADKLHQEELCDQAKDRETERKQMMSTVEGRATLFVEKVLEMFDTIHVLRAPGEKQISPVARDDIVFLTERMLRAQEQFKAEGVDTTVDIGYHYTSEVHMNQIRVGGLLTKKDRLHSGSGSHTNGAAFGDGVYTGNNPFAFRHFGPVGLIVARLKGKCYRRGHHWGNLSGQWGNQSARREYNTIIGRKAAFEDNAYSEEVVLTSSAQVIPVARFCSSLTHHFAGSQAKLLETFQKAIEAIVQVYFNDGASQAGTELPVRWHVPKRRTESDQWRSLSTSARTSNSRRSNLNQAAQTPRGYQSRSSTSPKAAPTTGRQTNWQMAPRGYHSPSSMSHKAAPTAGWQTNWQMNRKINSAIALDSPSIGNGWSTRHSQAAWGKHSVQGHTASWGNDAHTPSERVSYIAPRSVQSRDVKTMMEIIQGASTDECAICLSELSSRDVASLRVCGHHFHVDCITSSLQHSTRCPSCRKALSEPQGKSPSGTMTITSSSSITCQGFPIGAFAITYSLPAGQQHIYHDNPGTNYRGTTRVAYIPSNAEGQLLLRRLKYSFRRGLTFTVGTSLTSGASNVVIWSSVHHKTTLSGGTHGYPDPGFFANCNDELDALGVPAAVDL